jgi:hypothetical protein
MTNGGMIIVKLKNWDERKGKGQDINSVIGKVMVLYKRYQIGIHFRIRSTYDHGL